VAPPVFRDSGDLVILNVHALDPHVMQLRHILEEHVALPQELLGASHVKDYHGIPTPKYGESDPRGELCLDQTVDDPNLRPLGGDDGVNSHGAPSLRQLDQLGLDARGVENQAGQLIDHYHQIGQPDRCLEVVLLYISHLEAGQLAVPVRHVFLQQTQQMFSYLWVGDHIAGFLVREQVRDVLLLQKLDLLGIYQQEP